MQVAAKRALQHNGLTLQVKVYQQALHQLHGRFPVFYTPVRRIEQFLPETFVDLLKRLFPPLLHQQEHLFIGIRGEIFSHD